MRFRGVCSCRRPGSNRHGCCHPWDFKSQASANSATPAVIHFRTPRYFSIAAPGKKEEIRCLLFFYRSAPVGRGGARRSVLRHSRQNQSSVHPERDSRDVGSLVGTQETHRVRDVLRQPGPHQRDRTAQFILSPRIFLFPFIRGSAQFR